LPLLLFFPVAEHGKPGVEVWDARGVDREGKRRMITSLLLVGALAGAALIVYLLVSGVDESETWTARTRRRLRRERLQLRRRRRERVEDVMRERLERERIERRLDEEHARATLQDPE
jgi:uncharacterized protein YaiL (DUF2058 family)